MKPLQRQIHAELPGHIPQALPHFFPLKAACLQIGVGEAVQVDIEVHRDLQIAQIGGV